MRLCLHMSVSVSVCVREKVSVQILGPACTEGPSGAVRSAHELKIELSGPCSPHKNPLNTNNLINRELTQQNPTVTLKRILQINTLNT